MMVGNLVSGSSVFLKHRLYIWKFWVHVLMKPRLKDFKPNLVAFEMWVIVGYYEHDLALPFFVIVMNNDLSQWYGQCWCFQIYWYISAVF